MIALLQIATGTGLLISGIISGLSALGGTVATLYSRKKTEERQNQYNLDAEKRQQEYINAANEYNSPVEQMNRFREAGLNPYLVDDPGNQGELNSAITNTALDRSDIIQDTAKQIGDTATSTGQAFQNALLQEKKYQLDVAKLDAQKAQFDELLEFRRSQFDYDQLRDQINDAYRVSRDDVNDTYNQSILELKEKGLTFEQEKEERRKLESDRDYNLRLAADGREQQMHELRVKYQQTQNKYNDDAYNFFKNYELPNKELSARLERLTLDLDEDTQKLIVDNLKQSLRLKHQVQGNEITQQAYEAGLRAIWDLQNQGFSRFRNGNLIMNNPFEEGRGTKSSSLQTISKIALEMFK